MFGTPEMIRYLKNQFSGETGVNGSWGFGFEVDDSTYAKPKSQKTRTNIIYSTGHEGLRWRVF